MKFFVKNLSLMAQAYIGACICMAPLSIAGYAIYQILNGGGMSAIVEKISLGKLVELSGTLFFLVGVLGFPALLLYMLFSQLLPFGTKLSVLMHGVLGIVWFGLNALFVKDWVPSGDSKGVVPIFLVMGTLTGLIHGSLKYYLNAKEVTINA